MVSGTRGRAFESRIAHHHAIKGSRHVRDPFFVFVIGRLQQELTDQDHRDISGRVNDFLGNASEKELLDRRQAPSTDDNDIIP